MAGAPAAAGSRGAAASAPAVVGGFGGNVFPAESVEPAVASSIGSSVFPAASAGNDGRCPCCHGDERSGISTGGGWWRRR